ncbi:MAG: triose-phosphate isomerase [Erysipelotrichaceae bacterium]|nr:triose-phosphate isomerase [Erysipelotrichaceae bacterium]
MRKPIIFGNWKMNKTRKEAEEFVVGIEKVLNGSEKAEYGVATPFTCLEISVNNAKNLKIAAENCHFEESGAYTGEVSVPMLKDINVSHCVIGHSERRSMFNDTDESVNKKAKKLIDAGIVPIVCIGESESEYDSGLTEKVIRTQLNGSLASLNKEEVANIVIAYEPIWAIGTGKSATKEIAQNCCHIVRDEIKNMFGEDAANKVRVQYGGSVKPENIAEYMACEDIDGALIGGASLKVDSFTAIIEATR